MSIDDITVGSAHVDLGGAFQELAQDEIRKTARKYLGDLTNASVHVAREGRQFRCSVNMQLRGNAVMSGEAEGPEVPIAFRAALAKVEKQLRRTKRELREDKQTRPTRITTA
ncbi:HPF/RaiA family ribosome-associated protein [Alsobacter sp. KACC 23698]|uniref:HPF/RaiA family ribosome-associated protein n=1 Tax=Alsobacter sp. KACC 23698 TaxID=3149229 RepID=A0AAU7JL89_9HYPH